MVNQLQLGVQTGWILSDRIRKFNTDIRYPNIRADTDIVLNFNYPYPNRRYILYNLICIMKKIKLFTIIKNGYLYLYPKNKNGYGYGFTTIRSVCTPNCNQLISNESTSKQNLRSLSLFGTGIMHFGIFIYLEFKKSNL